MSAKKLLLTAALLAPFAALAATPASGDLNKDSLSLAWDGDGPYVFANLTPTTSAELGPESIVCDPAVPATCDLFTFTVAFDKAFREAEATKKETVSISIEFPDTTGQEDYDLYVYSSDGTLIGQSAGGAPQTSEKVTLPLRSLQDGSYTVRVIPYTPLTTNYSGLVQFGKPVPVSQAASLGGAANAADGGQFGAAGLGLFALAGLLGFRLLRRRA